MENLSKDILSTLQYLLPGFLASWIFYGLTKFPKLSRFERVIQALIYTLIIHVLVQLIMGLFFYIGTHYFAWEIWNESAESIWSVIIAVFIGILFAYFANSDTIHKQLRKMKITKETSFPSELIGTFAAQVTYVTLHFYDERRLIGWVEEWPSDPKNGYYVIKNPSWLDGTDKKNIGIEKILLNVKDIRWVEFMNERLEEKNV